MARCLRKFYWQRIRRWDSEICQECGGPVRVVWWCHDDFLWEKVTGHVTPRGSRESAPGILCIPCFDKAAKRACSWVEWAPVNLRHLQTKDEQDWSAAERWRLEEAYDDRPS